jgi:hypothetical protein
MPLDTSLILAGTPPPQPQNPLQTISTLAAIRGQGSENLLRTQQAADFQQQAQQRQRDMQDQNTIQQAMADPAINAKVHTGDFSALEGKVQPKTLDAVRQSQLAYQKDVQSQTEAQNKIRQDALGEINNTIGGLKTLPDLPTINGALPGAIGNLQASGTFKRAGIDPSKIPQTITDPAQLNAFQAQIGGALAAHEKALADKKTIAETQKNAADAQLTQQKADLQKQFVDQFKSNPQAGPQIINKIIDPKLDPATNQSYNGALQAAMGLGDMDAAAKLIEAASSHAASLNAKLNPRVADMEVNTAARKAQAEIGPHVSEAVQKQLAIAKTSSDALAGIADPTIRRQAEQGFEKVSMDAMDKYSDAQKLQDFVKAAQSGNKAAGGLIPLVELRQIVNRVNNREMQAAGVPGDLADKAIAVVDGWTKGVPQSPEGLKAIADLSVVSQQAALRRYRGQVGVIQGVYKAKNLQPIDIQSLYQNGAGGSSTALPKGSGQVIDKATAQQYYDAAGNDPAKARQLAVQNGWKVQ